MTVDKGLATLWLMRTFRMEVVLRWEYILLLSKVHHLKQPFLSQSYRSVPEGHLYLKDPQMVTVILEKLTQL
jgi:hypothetical protein